MVARIVSVDATVFEDGPVSAATADVSGRMRGAQSPAPPNFLEDPGVQKVLQIQGPAVSAMPKRGVMRGAEAPALAVVTAEADRTGDYVLIVRYPSGALKFLPPAQQTKPARRSPAAKRAAPRRQLTFHAPLVETVDDGARRSLLGDTAQGVIEFFLAKIGEAVAEAAVDLAEKAIWKALGRKPGLYKITQQTLAAGKLDAASGKIEAGPNNRALLFLHGTFSTTTSAFAEIAQSSLFARVRDVYGEAIYGFDHFTVSATPEENSKDILAKIASGVVVDVVTHSRGGLVLRTLVELSSGAPKFDLGRAVLIASPNEGTPLATPERWDDTVGWFANILDMFPPNPVTSNAALVAHWIAWLVRHGVKAANGIAAMDVNGTQIQRLQRPPAPAPDKYSALVSNYTADAGLMARAIDLGLDQFFQTANDLVVPSAGGWRIDKALASIPSARVGCYGPGGNMSGSAPVAHTQFFSRPDAIDFVVNALLDKPQAPLPEMDLSVGLPTVRRSGPRIAAPVALAALPLVAGVPENLDEGVRPLVAKTVQAQPYSSIFELTVIHSGLVEPREEFGEEDAGGMPFLLAAYGGARVTVPFRTNRSQPDRMGRSQQQQQQAEATHWGRLIAYHNRIKSYVEAKGKALEADELRDFGELLFDTLFQGSVRRLFDSARAREPDRLFMIFTSMIPWVFDMPWEFARDPDRGTFLATEDAHFIRNVLTPTPVEETNSGSSLKMLIAVSQPMDQVQLSGRQEAEQLKSSLESLGDLIKIEIEHNTTPERLHSRVANESPPFDIVHFIGHGYWEDNRSGLVLEDDQGKSSYLPERSMREILSGRRVRLVFLNACDTARGTPGRSGKSSSIVTGMAQDLFGRGVPNVVANQLKVGDQAALAFATAFYSHLGKGKTIAQATREARIAASYRKDTQSIDWAIPVVYARDPRDRLVNP